MPLGRKSAVVGLVVRRPDQRALAAWRALHSCIARPISWRSGDQPTSVTRRSPVTRQNRRRSSLRRFCFLLRARRHRFGCGRRRARGRAGSGQPLRLALSVESFRLGSTTLQRLVAEFQFRYKNRENADIFGTAIAGC
jgi:hypothetical protein